MPRKPLSKPRKITPDPVYSDKMVTKLINSSMKDGKKATAQKQIYAALALVEKQTKEPALVVFEKALTNIKPTMEVRPRRVGGAAYQVPMPVRGKRRESLGIRWLIDSARNRPNKENHTYADKLAAEIIAAAGGEGGAVDKKSQVEKMAEANRAFAHFRW